MGRSPSKSKNIDVKKGPWDPEEDKKLTDYINEYGTGNWISLPKQAGLNRCGKSCRLRWINYLAPEIKRGSFSPEEEHIILHYHKILGNKWSLISRKLPGRTDNEIKNFWNTHLKKKLIRAGCDPTTHQPRTDFMSCLRSLMALANLRNILSQNPLQDYNNKLQYMQQILHSGHILIDQIQITQMVNSLHLLRKNSSLNSLQQLENEATTMSQPLHHIPTLMVSSSLQDPQVPFTYNGSQFQPTTWFDGGSLGQSLDFGQQDSCFWNMVPSFPSTSETTSTGNAGEVTSTPSCNGIGTSEEEEEAAAYSQWEELLAEPIMPCGLDLEH